MAFTFEKNLSPEEHSGLKKAVREHSQINPALGIGYIALDWLVIAAIIFGTVSFQGPLKPLIYLLSVFLIATRQHALAVMSHEGAHYRLVPTKQSNTWVANLLCAYPLFFQVEVYRHSHLLHHQFTNEERDPDLRVQRGRPEWDFPMSGGKLLRLFAMDLLGNGAIANWKRLKRFNADPEFQKTLAPELAKSRNLRIAFYLVLITALTLLGAWKLFLLYWVVPLLWILPSILRLRNMSEHYGLTWQNDLQGTRDVVCSWLEGWLLAPHYIRIHLVHHLYPSIPFYRLPSMRKHLMKIKSYESGGHANSTYILPSKDAVWRDLTSIRSFNT
jgi:fatty acid desaturase